ncbi:SGNH/GDSL hydrolase family protein [Paenibacillus sp. JNUCC31]|uniref:SGNH/GDSL hydrolase family protein n=1 Tax=Paenibacillus sp. JNUCC-31 TaxID=2777983 RepID=UPI0017831A96|nr:SGNH/GDSL hydrolase family protein [Paenibacillus sp. JNUCC-31]QOS79042.1 SGNH/GDSL hydrolase family protein [Paenibacillus sp. JNUCC-31]
MQGTSEPHLDFESQAYREFISKSLLNKGHNARLKRAIEKTKRGEPVTIAYIGGSITQGAGAEPIHTNCYAYRSFGLFRNMFASTSNVPLRFIKAGLGGTPSELGIIRYDRDVLREGTILPDIVIVEFAVNDADDETQGTCYESLVLKALGADNDPAVILLFSVFENDWNLQDRLAPVGWHYNLPMVSVKDAVVDQFQLTPEDGRIISREQFFHDIYHPSNAGHHIMADCLSWLFDITNHSDLDKESHVIDKPPLIGNEFVDVKLLDRLNEDSVAHIEVGGFGRTDTDLQMAEMDDDPFGTPHFPNNWMHKGKRESGDGSFKMILRSKRLILVYKDSGSNEFGIANIRVDGKLVRIADPSQINWTHCHAMLLFDEKHAREHTIEIDMAEGHEDKWFTILGFGYVN